MLRATSSLSVLQELEWRVRRTADPRLGEPYRNKFIDERELTVILLFEDSLSLQFGSGRRTKRETLLQMAGLFALLCAGNRDRVGFWHASPHTHLLRQPVRGRTEILKVTAHLLNLPMPERDAGGEVVIDWQYLLRAFPHHSMVLWLSDFPPRPLPAAWVALSRRYQLIGVRVEDPWERVPPRRGALTGIGPVRDEMVPFHLLSSANRRRHARWVEERDAYWEQLFPARVARVTVQTDDDLLAALIRFFKARARRVRQ